MIRHLYFRIDRDIGEIPLQKMVTRLMEFLAAFILLIFILWFMLTQPVWVSATKQNVPKADPQALYHSVKTLSETLPPRYGTEEALQPTIEWIETQLAQYGQPTRQSYQVGKETFHNIVLNFGPDTNEVIVVGAHYDTAHGLPGADDNGSGVAGVIELARFLSEEKLSKQVELVAYTLEEPPYFRTHSMGSFVHAESLQKAQRKVLLMISLEMIGYFSDEPGSQEYPAPMLNKLYPTKGDFIAIVGNVVNMGVTRRVKKSFKAATDLPVYSINAPTMIPGIDFSDHQNYWKLNFPAVMVTDTAFARNQAYHTAEDTADRLDYKKMAQVVEATYATVLEFAQ